MKDLLEAIKEHLQGDDNLDYVRDLDIEIVPHENYISHAFNQYYIGIKDGRITNTETAAGMVETRQQVKISLYVQLAKNEAAIVGDISTSKKGILEFADDVNNALDENLFDIAGMMEAFCPEENESRFFGDEKDTLQQKIMVFEYMKETLRPSQTSK